MMQDVEEIIKEITLQADAKLKHNDTVGQINQIFRKHGYYTTFEYPIFKMKDGSNRKGRIDLVARKGKFRVAIEYDHQKLVKWKSFQKILQIRPETAIAICGKGDLVPNIARAIKYQKQLKIPLYVISLKQRNYELLKNSTSWEESVK